MKNDKNSKDNTPELSPEEVQVGLRFFSNTIKQMSEDIERFNKNRKEAEERIKRGARRTSGRII
ncbi:MAG TPA: hypothetical protein PKY82_23850 [Pyrinomonadaceae bacterium]|nr:hypothetical protein [Pyrinomonadaceae bacterium]